MKLIGMLDSPYVRRVAIDLQLLGLRFEHESLSVFRTYAEFAAINPVVKAPSFVCDGGTVLMDSSLILEYAEALARPRSLKAGDPQVLQRDLRLTGLALAICEKAAQLIYERRLRPPEKQHEPWIERVSGQLRAACTALELELAAQPPAVTRATIRDAGVCVGVAWYFAQRTLPELLPTAEFPRLVAYSAQAEALPEFIAAPYGEGTYRPAR
jgi:glutathione S-transferase